MNNNTFCILPWIHTYVDPIGGARACCEQTEKLDTFVSSTETINSLNFKNLRKDLYNGKRPSACKSCWFKENKGIQSNRQQSNYFYKTWVNKEYIDSITNYNDFSLNDKFRYRYLDIRHSNICNYKCRFCSLELSSSWYNYDKKSDLVQHKNFNKKSGVLTNPLDFEDIKKHIPYVKHINFAGGEPIMIMDTYRLLEEFKKQNKTDVKVNIVSNTSRLKYKNKDIVSLLLNFDNSSWSMSIDAIGSAHGYLRSGTNDWKQVYQNSKKLINISKSNQSKKLLINVMSSIGWINLYRFYNVWRLYYNSVEKIKFNPVVWPKHMNIGVLPVDELIKARDFYLKKIKEHNHIEQVKHLQPLVGAINNCIENPDKDLQQLFFQSLEFQKQFDKIRKQSFADTFPEWKHLLHD